MPLLSIEHQPQQDPVGCLAACTQMALAHIGVVWSQHRLNRLFEITSMGVPLSRVRRLENQGRRVLLQFGDEFHIRQFIDRGLPLIAFVRTVELPYWTEDVEHAVLIVGYDDMYVYLNDPAFLDAPQRSDWGNFMLAWDEFDYIYAVLNS